MCPVCGEEGCNDSTVFYYCVVCCDDNLRVFNQIEDRHYPLVCAECAGDRARWDDEVGQEEIVTYWSCPLHAARRGGGAEVAMEEAEARKARLAAIRARASAGAGVVGGPAAGEFIGEFVGDCFYCVALQLFGQERHLHGFRGEDADDDEDGSNDDEGADDDEDAGNDGYSLSVRTTDFDSDRTLSNKRTRV
jgi:hypothetical protein